MVDPQTAHNLPAGAPGNWEPKPQPGRLIPAHPHQPATPKLYYEVQVAGSSASHSSSLNQKHSLVMPPLAKIIPPLGRTNDMAQETDTGSSPVLK